MNILTKRFFLIVVCMFVASTGVAFAQEYSVLISVDPEPQDNLGTITATSTPPPTSFPMNCTNSTFCYGYFSSGAVITITATPSANAIFTGWTVTKNDGYIGPVPTGECTGTTTTCTVIVSDYKIVKAKFGVLKHNLSFTPQYFGIGKGYVSSTPIIGINCGPVCWPQPNIQLAQGTILTVHAKAEEGSTFKGWLVTTADGNSTNECPTATETCVVVMNVAKSLTVSFEKPEPPPTYSIPISVVPSDPNTTSTLGTITATSVPPNIQGWDCTNSTFCYGHYPAGAVITITATPSTGAVVTGWDVTFDGGGTTGECVGTATTCVITASAHKFVKAKFGAFISNIQYRVRISKSPIKGTFVKSNDGLISCGSACGRKYSAGATIILNASSTTPNLSFLKWNNASKKECHGSTSSKCILSDLNQSQNLTAEFKKVFFPVVVVKYGSGKVVGKPTGISCGRKCVHNYQGGTSVTFTASPNTTSTFVGWGGACVGFSSSTRCTILVDGNKEVIANFSQ